MNYDSNWIDENQPIASQFPKIVILGDETDIKYQFLEYFAGFEFLPKNQIEQRPLEIRSTKAQDELLRISNENYFEKKLNNFEDSKGKIKEIQQMLQGEDSARNKSLFELEISGPLCPDNLTFLSLPKNQFINIDETVYLVNKFCKDRYIILFILTCKSQAIEGISHITKKLDPNGNRTIGVVSLIDDDDEASLQKLIQNQPSQLGLGYFGIKLRSEEEINLGITLIQAEDQEEIKLQNKKYDIFKQQKGKKALVEKLTQIMSESIHIILVQVQEQFVETKYKLQILQLFQINTAEDHRNILRVMKSYLTQLQTLLTEHYQRSDWYQNFEKPDSKGQIFVNIGTIDLLVDNKFVLSSNLKRFESFESFKNGMLPAQALWNCIMDELQKQYSPAFRMVEQVYQYFQNAALSSQSPDYSQILLCSKEINALIQIFKHCLKGYIVKLQKEQFIYTMLNQQEVQKMVFSKSLQGSGLVQFKKSKSESFLTDSNLRQELIKNFRIYFNQASQYVSEQLIRVINSKLNTTLISVLLQPLRFQINNNLIEGHFTLEDMIDKTINIVDTLQNKFNNLQGYLRYLIIKKYIDPYIDSRGEMECCGVNSSSKRFFLQLTEETQRYAFQNQNDKKNLKNDQQPAEQNLDSQHLLFEERYKNLNYDSNLKEEYNMQNITPLYKSLNPENNSNENKLIFQNQPVHNSLIQGNNQNLSNSILQNELIHKSEGNNLNQKNQGLLNSQLYKSQNQVHGNEDQEIKNNFPLQQPLFELNNLNLKEPFKDVQIENIKFIDKIMESYSKQIETSQTMLNYLLSLCEQKKLKILELQQETKQYTSINQIKSQISASNEEVLFYVLSEQLRKDCKSKLLITKDPQKIGLSSILFTGAADWQCYKWKFENQNYEKIMKDNNSRLLFIKNFKTNISKTLNIEMEDIEVYDIIKGSVEVRFQLKTKEQLNQQEIQLLEEVCEGKIEIYNYLFESYCDPPYQSLLALSINDFSPEYNEHWDENHYDKEQRGPSFHRYDYYFPKGYYGYALKVLERYRNESDGWIQMDGNKDEWRILYHGTNRISLEGIAQSGLRPGGAQAFDDNNCKDFYGNNVKVGKGVYFSDQIKICETYADPIAVGQKKFILIFQTRVNPKEVKQSVKMKQLRYFLVNKTKDIRPYRILLREIK